jgi:hypothetical protein
MTMNSGPQWVEASVMGIRYRYCKEKNLVQRKYIFKQGWETMPDRPDLAVGRADIIRYIMNGGDTSKQQLIKTAKW